MMIAHLTNTWYRHDLFSIDDKFAKTKNEFMNSGTLLQKYLNSKLKICQNSFFLLEMFICNCCF